MFPVSSQCSNGLWYLLLRTGKLYNELFIRCLNVVSGAYATFQGRMRSDEDRGGRREGGEHSRIKFCVQGLCVLRIERPVEWPGAIGMLRSHRGFKKPDHDGRLTQSATSRDSCLRPRRSNWATHLQFRWVKPHPAKVEADLIRGR